MRKVFIVRCFRDKYQTVRDGLLNDGLDTPDRGYRPHDVIVVEETDAPSRLTGAVAVLDVLEVEQTGERQCRLKVKVCGDTEVCR